MNLADLMLEYPDEAAAERYFIQRRWPNGVRCTGCGSSNVLRGTQAKRKRQLWYCGHCSHQFSITSGTIMASTNLPLRAWLAALYVVCLDLIPGHGGKVNISEFSRILRITYKSAWALMKKIDVVVPDGPTGEARLDIAISNMVGSRLTIYSGVESEGIWASRSTDRLYDNRSRAVEFFGASLTLSEIGEVAEKSPRAIHMAMRGGKTAEEAAIGRPTVERSTKEHPVTDAQIRASFSASGTVAGTARLLGIKHGTCWSRCVTLGLLAHKEPKKRVASEKRSCSRCGEHGHNARTCAKTGAEA